MIDILLVMDHAAFRQPLALVLGAETDMAVIGDVGTLREARPFLARAAVVLLELEFVDGDATELVRDLAVVNHAGAALLLTPDHQHRALASAVPAGALGVAH